MRELSKYALENPAIRINLDLLSEPSTNAAAYRSAFFALGKALGKELREKIGPNAKIILACSSEDADWLTNGILESLALHDLRLAVFWNLRSDTFKDADLTIAPIIKSYMEPMSVCDTMIITKSIIHTACVVRTNLSYLIERLNPKQIFIVAPVVYRGAEEKLKADFSQKVSDIFQFLYFATDDEQNQNGEVIPGIGGSVYDRLGLGNAEDKLKYVPQIVKDRRVAFAAQ